MRTQLQRQVTPGRIAWAVALLLLFVFGLQNRAVTTIHVLFWTVDIGLIWALLGTALLGAVVGYGAAWRRLRRHR